MRRFSVTTVVVRAAIRRLADGCVWLALAVLLPATVLAAPDHDQNPAVRARADHHAGVGAAVAAVPFRLGTAARPFGWSTSVADFNTDGIPDIAVADSLGRWGGAYAYRMEFSVSGRAPHAVAFESSQDALKINVSDVDDDDDLDVVVTGFLSGEPVGVWLNDGHGRFASAEVRRVFAAIGPLRALDTRESPLNAPICGPSSAGAHHCCVVVARTPPSGCHGSVRDLGHGPLQPPVHFSPIAPRAPPSNPANSLS
ncbi:MAG: FG-GAP repeat protein [Acidobacteriota bacterium]